MISMKLNNMILNKLNLKVSLLALFLMFTLSAVAMASETTVVVLEAESSAEVDAEISETSVGDESVEEVLEAEVILLADDSVITTTNTSTPETMTVMPQRYLWHVWEENARYQNEYSSWLSFWNEASRINNIPATEEAWRSLSVGQVIILPTLSSSTQQVVLREEDLADIQMIRELEAEVARLEALVYAWGAIPQGVGGPEEIRSPILAVAINDVDVSEEVIDEEEAEESKDMSRVASAFAMRNSIPGSPWSVALLVVSGVLMLSWWLNKKELLLKPKTILAQPSNKTNGKPNNEPFLKQNNSESKNSTQPNRPANQNQTFKQPHPFSTTEQ
jgi:hypothetical protein